MENAEIQIREITAEDKEQWLPLWLAYIEFYESSMPAGTTEYLWQSFLNPEKAIYCRVAVKNQKLIGLVHYFPHPHTWYQTPVCYLNDLFVSPDIRGSGAGEALIQAVITQAKQQGWAEVYWLTQQSNQVARGLYDKITGGTDGFVTYTLDISKQ